MFGLASLAGRLAQHAGLLIAARAAQGIGGAVLFPSTLSLVNTTFEEGRERNRAIAVWGSAGAGGLSLGVLAGGVLTGLREGLASLLERSGFEVVGQAGDAAGLLALAREHHPELLIVDIRMPRPTPPKVWRPLGSSAASCPRPASCSSPRTWSSSMRRSCWPAGVASATS